MVGTYVGSTAYKTGDVVRYGGHTYVAKQDATGVVQQQLQVGIN